MTTTKKEDAVFDALAQSAADLSDEEVAAEYREEGEDLTAVASRVRGILSAPEWMREAEPVTAVSEDDAKLVWRVVYAEAHRRARTALWSRVGSVFAIGSTSARELCRRFDFDPEQRRGEAEPCP